MRFLRIIFSCPSTFKLQNLASWRLKSSVNCSKEALQSWDLKFQIECPERKRKCTVFQQTTQTSQRYVSELSTFPGISSSTQPIRIRTRPQGYYPQFGISRSDNALKTNLRVQTPFRDISESTAPRTSVFCCKLLLFVTCTKEKQSLQKQILWIL